jgi:long-chain acyl-CoA synthetase
VDLIDTYNASIVFEFSPILSALLDAKADSGQSLKSLRAVTGLDTPEVIEKYQQITGGTFYSLFGQTETSCITTLSPYNDQIGSSGRPVPMATVKLLDDNDREVRIGEIGEIGVRGPMVFGGYWNLPEDNDQTFRNGWHHTGDLGRMDDEGFLWYEGRKSEKELIKPGGENVYPTEVESVILQHPAVKETIVFGVPDPKWKEGIKALCVLKPGQRLTAKELIDFVAKRIASYKKPQYVEFVADLIRDQNGNIDRDQIRKKFGAV